MIHWSTCIALLDACVLYPAPIRDFLLHLADVGLFSPRWTDKIHEEWTRNLRLNRPDLSAEQLQKTVAAMNNAFPEATVRHYETLMASIDLPDQDDRHVLAAAVRCQADIIITANLKDFPREYVTSFGLDIQHPDHFIVNLIETNPEKSVEAFLRQVSYLKNPPLTNEHVLTNFRNVGLPRTANRLAGLL